MEKILGSNPDIEIVVCKYEFYDDNQCTYGCKIFSGGDSRGEASNSSLAALAIFAVEQIDKLFKQYDREWCVVRFPNNSLVSANMFGQLHLLKGLSENEQRTFFIHFAMQFKKRKLNAYNSDTKRIGILGSI